MIYPISCQVVNKPAWFLVFFSMTCFCTTITVGMNQVLMPALQQLFNMTSKQMGTIINSIISWLYLCVSIVTPNFSISLLKELFLKSSKLIHTYILYYSKHIFSMHINKTKGSLFSSRLHIDIK